MLLLFVATQLACVSSYTLRGVASPASAPAPATAPKSTKPVVDDRGERGHFYYAEKCEDCVYKGAQCGCQPAMEYMACLTKHCGAANTTSFVDKCTALGSKCFQDIDMDCRSHNTVCASKNFQLPNGGVGLKVVVDEDDAFCGPTGICIGKLHMKATIVNGPKGSASEAVSDSTAPAPAPSSRNGKKAPAPSTAAAPSAGSPGPAAAAPTTIWLECGLANNKKADLANKSDWNICQIEAEGDEEVDCELPLPDDWLKASEAKKAYCVLKDGEDGARLTQPSWHEISNVHEKSDEVAAEEDVAEEKEVDTEVAEKAPKAKTDDIVDITDEPPWMKDKEERQRKQAKKAKKVAAAKAKEPKEDKKKKAAKMVHDGPHESGLPWMDGSAPTPDVSIFNKAAKAKKTKPAKDEPKKEPKDDAKKEEPKKEEPKKEESKELKKLKQLKKDKPKKEPKEDEPKKEPKKEEPKKEEEAKKAPKAEDKKKAMASNVVKTGDKQENEDPNQLPWMADKEERQEKAKKAAAAKAKKPKKATKPTKKKKAKMINGPHDSGLPWMDGKPATPDVTLVPGSTPKVSDVKVPDVKVPAAPQAEKLPWMEDKEKRQKKAKKAAAAKAKEPKKDTKKKKKPKMVNTPHDSGLPWMDGKAATPDVVVPGVN